MEIKPQGKWVLIGELKQDQTTLSGIIIEGNDNSKLGKVVAVGPEVTTIKVDDKVVPIWSEGHLLKVPGRQYVLIPEYKLICILA